MRLSRQIDALRAFCLAAVAVAASGGCTSFLEPREPYPITPPEPSPLSSVPRELDMVSLPPYVIEPPDILVINAVKIVPKPPHKIEPFDGLLIRVANAFADAADCRCVRGRSGREGRPRAVVWQGERRRPDDG